MTSVISAVINCPELTSECAVRHFTSYETFSRLEPKSICSKNLHFLLEVKHLGNV